MKGLNHALVEAIHACESADTDGNSWTCEEQDAAWVVARYLLALPVEQRMAAMGMEHIGWTWPDQSWPKAVPFHFCPNDGIGPPPRKGLRPAYAPTDTPGSGANPDPRSGRLGAFSTPSQPKGEQ